MQFSDFIAPIPADRFMAEYFDAQPLHIPADGQAGDRRRALLDWPRLSELLGILPHWTEENVQLVMNSSPIHAEHFITRIETSKGLVTCANPGMIEAMLAMGASLVADGIEDVAPEIREITAMLGDEFAGRPGANVYCSFKGVQAFASHCDLHEVFAVQCTGEKAWRIYENRADTPVRVATGEDAQARIDAAKGPVMLELTMRPGDLLYIPRGYYHDAMASSAQSLHLTFAVAPLYGRAIFSLLEELALQHSEFRAYLPDAETENGAALERQLALLSDKLAELMQSPAIREDIAVRQRTLAPRFHRADLPNLAKPEYFMRTGKACTVRQPVEGSVLHVDGEEYPLNLLSDAANWLLGQQLFSVQQLCARFAHHPPAELQQLVQQLTRLGVIAPHSPRRS